MNARKILEDIKNWLSSQNGDTRERELCIRLHTTSETTAKKRVLEIRKIVEKGLEK